MRFRKLFDGTKRKLAVATLGIGSVFSTGCDLEEYLGIAQTLGVSDLSAYSQLAGKDDDILLVRANEGIHNFDVDGYRFQYQNRHC